MTTLLVTHPIFTEHDTGFGHPERPDRMRAIDKVLEKVLKDKDPLKFEDALRGALRELARA